MITKQWEPHKVIKFTLATIDNTSNDLTVILQRSVPVYPSHMVMTAVTAIKQTLTDIKNCVGNGSIACAAMGSMIDVMIRDIDTKVKLAGYKTPPSYKSIYDYLSTITCLYEQEQVFIASGGQLEDEELEFVPMSFLLDIDTSLSFLFNGPTETIKKEE